MKILLYQWRFPSKEDCRTTKLVGNMMSTAVEQGLARVTAPPPLQVECRKEPQV